MNGYAIALVTAVAARDVDDDMPLLESALRNAGADVTIAEWDVPRDWAAFDLALIRSPWDYTRRLEEFLAWTERVSAQTTLLNPAPVVKWNSDKHYLAELAKRGVPTVPTRFVEPGEAVAPRLAQILGQSDVAEFVVKPAVGAGAYGAQRFGRDDRESAIAHAERLLAESRSVMLQPYLDKVDEHGESALIHFNGEFSHAIRKAPILKRNAQARTGLFAKETITPRVPDDAERALAAKVLQALPFATPLYARVDMIRDRQGEPVLLELELIEPSLFFPYAPGAAERFVIALESAASA